jgi:hypothetical protein
VAKDDDQIYVSRINDPQSQRASDVLGVGRGTGGELRSAYKFGTECVCRRRGAPTG